MNEKLSLVLFTLLAQAGIGLAVATQVFGAEGSRAATASLVAVLLTAAGLAVASSHLGSPLSAHRALSNLKTSWLSRECLALASFLALGAVMFLLARRVGPAGTTAWVGGLMILAGCSSLFSMACLYGRTAIPAWRRLHTHISFYTAAVALGTLSLALIEARNTLPADWVPQTLVLAAGAVVIQLVEHVGYLTALGTSKAGTQASLRLLVGLPLISGLILTAVGGLAFPALAYAALGSATGNQWLSLAVASLATGQVLVRYTYYASGVHAMTAGWANIAYRPARRATRQRL